MKYIDPKSVTFWSGIGLLVNGTVDICKCIFTSDCPPEGLTNAITSLLMGLSALGLRQAIKNQGDPNA